VKTEPLRLYDFPFSGNGYKLRLAMTQLDLEFDYIAIDSLTGEAVPFSRNLALAPIVGA